MTKLLLPLALSLFITAACSQQAPESTEPTLHPEVIDTVERELAPPAEVVVEEVEPAVEETNELPPIEEVVEEVEEVIETLPVQ